MNKKHQSIIIAIVVVAVIFFFRLDAKITNLQYAISNQQSYISRLEQSVWDTNNRVGNITSEIKDTMEKQQKMVLDKSHSILSYGKEQKNALMQIDVTLKELEKESQVFLKVDKGTKVSKILMDNREGLSYTTNLEVGTLDLAKLSVVTEGSLLQEEHLFDIELKKILEGRFRINNQSSGYSTNGQGTIIGYSKTFELINLHSNDSALKMKHCHISLKANDQEIYEGYQTAIGNYVGYEEAGEALKINIGGDYGEEINLNQDKGTSLELILTIDDELGLKYEYKESEYLPVTIHTQQNGNSTQMSVGSSLDKADDYYTFRLINE